MGICGVGQQGEKKQRQISKASAINKKKVGRWNKRVNMDGWIFLSSR